MRLFSCLNLGGGRAWCKIKTLNRKCARLLPAAILLLVRFLSSQEFHPDSTPTHVIALFLSDAPLSSKTQQPKTILQGEASAFVREFFVLLTSAVACVCCSCGSSAPVFS
ncbi:Hypothetical predicted protein [Podarcis lilfordi]|uniref:Uncharacterized protein n=1 Tax=Podarcis lilfordi TaxID=74358 RepID=A0AA35PQN3_9SAUR|nr:Hypothetical predicted protein [Podarcis lilfordi]